MRPIALALALLLATTNAASATEWPQNWLGPSDDSYMALRIGVYYFGAVLHDLPDAEGNPALPGPAEGYLNILSALPEMSEQAKQAEFERVKGEIEEGAYFMWRNSRFNFAVDYEYITEFEPCLRSSITGGDAPYYSPVDFEYYGDARDEYDGLMQIMVLYRYDDETGELERIKGGGGFTWGCDAETAQCGWSWWAACTEDNVCGSDWLVVHEFGHQMDSLFDQSGHPEFWFNHLAPAEGNTARFGEHFDANSYIMRRVPEADWLDLKWGEVRQYEDSDGDGVPAADDWLTSRGYLTDPDDSSADTDGDGLTDYDEFMLANGNRYGHGERLHPSIGYCDPTNPDSDGDGLLDGNDPFPTLDFPSYIPDLLNISLMDRRIESLHARGITELPYGLDINYLGSGDDEEVDGGVADPVMGITIFNSLFGEQGDDLEYKLMLDLDNNGWFYGDDNYQVLFTNDGVTKISRHLAASHSEWPHIAAVEADTDSMSTFTEGIGLVLLIRQSEFPELSCKPGEMIGLNIGGRHAGESWYYMLGEPNTLIPFELR